MKEKLKGLGLNEQQTKALEKIFQEHEAQIKALKLENAVNTALICAGAKNKKAVRAMLELDNAELDENGNVKGLDEQIKALKKSDGYMFEERTKFTGVVPGESRDGLPGGKNVKDMTYTELAAYLENNPNAEI